jgi:spermidine synthase
MRVIIADAAVEIQSEEWLGTVDMLHVDLYDHEAAAPVLDHVAFYKNCRALLSDEGTMTVNLFGRTSSYEKSLTKMAEAFGQDALWAFKPTREGNTVVMAQRIASRPKKDQLLAQAEAVENRFGLPATKWLKVFKPLVT